MRKKQWYALGFLLIITDIIFHVKYFSLIHSEFFSILPLKANAMMMADNTYYMSLTIKESVYNFLYHICQFIELFLGTLIITCFIMAWLEKEK